MVRTVYLDKDEHAATLLDNLEEMKHEDDLCDFIIKVDENEYKAHKVVLSASSPYFKAMFRYDTKERRDGKVTMKGVNADCVKICIDFLYCGHFDIRDGKTEDFLHVAVMMQLEKVKDAICDIFFEELNAENFYEIRNIAEIYNLEAVSLSCMEFYEENFLAISAQPGFVTETLPHLVNLFKSDLVLSDEQKLTAALSWIGEDMTKRQENLPELIELIDLEEVPPEFLRNLLKNHQIISNDFHLYKIFSAPLVDNLSKGNLSADENSTCHETMILFDATNNCLQSYDQVTSAVHKIHSGDITHFESYTAVAIDSYIYVLCWDLSVYRLFWKSKQSKWEQMADMGFNHGDWPPAVSFSGSIFVIGGSAQLTKDVEQFDPVDNEWSILEDKPEAVGDATLAQLDNSIYCIGGWERADALDSFCRYTPHTSEWADLTPMMTPRSCCGAVAVQQKLIVMGGWDGYECINETECYDIITEQWTSLSPAPRFHKLCFARLVDGWICVMESGCSSDQVDKYDIANDSWCQVRLKNAGSTNLTILDCVIVKS